ncbi:hypothetical protein WA026_009458 [Henosepilachna vigintioctopunctata]|uniref:Uncharacterized protein n=1 Tax=Henosepilachna vigintioctopunctata TaxID=420089 RepID=A0AAW1U4P9_9CUCU
MRFSKVQSENVPSTSKLKSFVGKSDEVNVEIGKIVEFHGLNRQNRNSAMKYLSFSDEYSKNTLDVFPEVFFTPFASKTNVAKEMDVVSEDTEENFGILQNLSNVGQVKTGISKVIHIATNDPTKNNTRNLTYANDIRTSCRVNDFPNSKICREIDKPASKNIQNFEYLKKRIEQDRLKTHAKVSNSKDEMKAKKKSEETLPNKKKCDEISEDLKQAFAGLEKMGNSIKEKPSQRENVSERSSVRTPIGDYLRSQRRDFATKNPFIYSNDLTQSLSKKLYPKKSNVEARAQFVQMKVEVPEDAKKESLNKSPEADMKTSQNVSRKNSFYHEMVRRSEANKKTIEKKKEIDIVPENSTFCVFNAMKESFDEVCATKKVYLGSRPSMKQYAQMIMADEVKSCNELSQMKNKSFSNTNSNVENPKIEFSENEDPKLPASEMYLYNLETTKHNRPQSSGSIGISNGNKSNEIQSTRGAILNTQKYFKTEEPEERDFKTFDVTAILEKKQKRSPDSLLGSVHYEPLVIEDLHVTIGENSESHKEDDFSFKPKISQIPIRTSDVMPKHNVLEKFAAIERAPGSPVYKIRGDLTFDSSTKRIQKNANATHEKQKPRPQVSNAKSKGVAVQEHATKKPSTAKPKSKKMVVKLTPSKQLYSPPQKNDHDDLKRTLLKNPSKLLEIAGEIMDKNQYLNFLLDLKSRKEIRNFWWKKIYDGILSSLKLTETFTTKTKRSEKSNIKVKSSFPSDATKMKSKKAMKVIKKESFNLESLFIAPKKERKKEKIIVVKEKPAMPNLTKRLTTKSLRATPNSEVNPNIISIEKDTDNMRSKSANLKSPKGNQMLKSDTNQDSTNRRNLSSQHRESVSSKNNSLPYTLKKYLETPDLTTKKSNVRNVENKRAVENFQNVFVLGEELKMPKLKYTVACVGMPNEFEKFNGKQIVEEELIVNKSQRNLEDIASSQLLSKSTHLKDVETTSMLEEECFKEIQLQAEEGMKSFSDYKNEDTSKGCDGLNHGSITEIDISENVDEKPPTSSLQLAEMNNVVVKTRSDKDSVFEIPEHLITDESIGDGIDNSVELSAQPSSEKSFLKPDNDINQNSDLNMNASENSHIHLDEGEMNVFAKEAPRSIASSIKDSSDLDNYFDVLSFPISSTRSEIEECRVKMMDTGEFDDSSDVFSNRSAPASSACSAAREYMNAARRAASITSNTGEILQRDALFDDMRKSNQKLMIGAKPTGNMNFQTRRKFENPLSKFVSKKKTTHSGHVSNVQHSQESIPDTHVENTAKVRVIRTKSLSEVLKDDPYFLTRLREQKKPPPYVTPRRVEEAPRKFEYRYHDFRRKYDVGGKPSAKSQPRKKDFFEKFRDLIQTKRPFGEDNQRSQGEEAEQTRPKLATKFNEKIKCVEDDKAADSEKSDKADGAATDRNTNSTRNFCNSLLLKSKFGSWRFVHTKMEHIDEDELMTWVQEHPHTPMSRSRTDNSKGDENDKHNVIHVPWISSSANAEEDN